MTTRAKKIAAALAAVGAFLDEEAAGAARARRRQPPAAGPSPWALAGRLSLVGSRLASRALARG